MILTPKRKHIAPLVAILVIALSSVLYYKPMQLPEMLGTYTHLRYCHVELDVQDGKVSDVITLSDDECDNLMDIFGQYTYARTIQTIFSDGFTNGIGDDAVYIFTYNEDVSENCIIIISSMDTIAVNDKVYAMSNSTNLINEITAMMGE